jgi:hypothetical protein
MIPFCHIFSAIIYLVAYMVAAIYSHQTEHHRDMCPIYLVIVLAAAFHLAAVVITEHQKKKGPGNTKGDS